METDKVENQTDDKQKKEKDKEVVKTCFIIMPISDIDKYPPGHFRRVYEYIIDPACRLAGFKAKRADDVKSANVIMVDVLESILHSDMAICDLSASNPNVLYELGIRQSFDMPVTLIKDELTKDIFDIQGIRYLQYSSQLRIDLVDDTVKLLAASITETYENRDKDVSSLVQILGRQKATVKTNKLSDEATVLLDAIMQINEKIKGNDTVNNNPHLVSVRLANGLVIRAGDTVHHNKYGNGLVTSISTVGSESKFSVRFQNEEKVFLSAFALGFTKGYPNNEDMPF